MRVLLTSLVLTFPGICLAQQQSFSTGDLAVSTVQELNRAYNIGAMALGSCQQSSAAMKAELDKTKAELESLKKTTPQ